MGGIFGKRGNIIFGKYGNENILGKIFQQPIRARREKF